MGTITIKEFYADVQAQPHGYAIVERNKMSPVYAKITFNKVVAVDTYPAAIALLDDSTCLRLSQIQSIKRKGDGYLIICGVMKEEREQIRLVMDSSLGSNDSAHD